MTSRSVLQAVLVSGVFVCAAFAQGGPQGPPPGGPRGAGQFGPGRFGPGMHSGKVVTGAPYTATATNTFTQTLQGGNTIQRTTTAIVARDIQGRTYEQETITGGPLAAANGGSKVVTFITDPVAGYSYVLDASTKTAVRRALHTPPSGALSQNATRPQRPANPNVVEQDLTASTMNGVTVTGKSMTHTIPAGQVGNAQAITWTDTVYTSPDLHVVVSATRNDPRFGSSAYALTNIQRGDPTTVSFAVPSDYTVTDAKSFGGRGPHPPQQ